MNIKELPKKAVQQFAKPVTKSYESIKESANKFERIRAEHKKDIVAINESRDLVMQSSDEYLKLKTEISEQEFKRFVNVFSIIKSPPSMKELTKEGVNLPEIEIAEIKQVSDFALKFIDSIEKIKKWSDDKAKFIKTTLKKHPFIFSAILIAVSPHLFTASAIGTGIGLGASGLGASIGVISAGTSFFSFSSGLIGLLSAGYSSRIPALFYRIKAEKAGENEEKAHKSVEKTIKLHNDIKVIIDSINDGLNAIVPIYDNKLSNMEEIINKGKTDYNSFSTEEKKLLENLIILTKLVYKICSFDPYKNGKIKRKESKIILQEIDLVMKEN